MGRFMSLPYCRRARAPRALLTRQHTRAELCKQGVNKQLKLYRKQHRIRHQTRNIGWRFFSLLSLSHSIHLWHIRVTLKYLLLYSYYQSISWKVCEVRRGRRSCHFTPLRISPNFYFEICPVSKVPLST